MKWVELKMEQLGVLNNPHYKITALLDHLAMITVQSDSRGIFDCKPLGLIWAHFPEVYSIMIHYFPSLFSSLFDFFLDFLNVKKKRFSIS